MKDETFKDFILDQLQSLDGVEARRMFGGYGVYAGEQFFAIISDGRIYFKTNESTRKRYAGFGMKPFKPSVKQTLKNYYEVPVDVIEDADLLAQWANEAAQL